MYLIIGSRIKRSTNRFRRITFLPSLEEKDVTACLIYAASKVNHPVLITA
jgi:hypothetical protein